MRTAHLGTLSIVAATVCGLTCFAPVAAEPPAAPLPTDSGQYLVPPAIPYGSRITRTMRLLATSTPEHKHRVRILFYGQSITGGWTDIVLRDLPPVPQCRHRRRQPRHRRIPSAIVVADGRRGPVSVLS